MTGVIYARDPLLKAVVAGRCDHSLHSLHPLHSLHSLTLSTPSLFYSVCTSSSRCTGSSVCWARRRYAYGVKASANFSRIERGSIKWVGMAILETGVPFLISVQAAARDCAGIGLEQGRTTEAVADNPALSL